MSNNTLCKYCGEDRRATTTGTNAGITAIANAIPLSHSLKSLAVSHSLESLAVSHSPNFSSSLAVAYSPELKEEAALQLLEAMKDRDMVSIGMARCGLRVAGAKAVAALVSVSRSLKQVLALVNRTEVGVRFVNAAELG